MFVNACVKNLITSSLVPDKIVQQLLPKLRDLRKTFSDLKSLTRKPNFINKTKMRQILDFRIHETLETLLRQLDEIQKPPGALGKKRGGPKVGCRP